MKKIWLLLALLSAAPALHADFEGVLHMKLTTPQGGGVSRVSLSKKGVRNETEFRTGGTKPMKMTVLVLHAVPDTVYMISDEQKSYSELNAKSAREHAHKAEKGFTVKDLGEDTVLGYRCKHVLITHPRGGESELWTSREILDYASFARARGPEGKDGEGEGFMKALKDAGADGFPVKSIHRGAKKGGEVVTELVKVEKKSLSGDLFKVPAGYTKSESAFGAAMPEESRKAMQEQMKKMSPDKKKMLEDMLKGRLK